MSTTSKRWRWLQDELAGRSTRFRAGGFALASRAFLRAAPRDKPMKPTPGLLRGTLAELARFADNAFSADCGWLASVPSLPPLTLVTPFAFENRRWTMPTLLWPSPQVCWRSRQLACRARTTVSRAMADLWTWNPAQSLSAAISTLYFQ